MVGRSIAMVLLLFAASVHAQTRYVSDRTIVELRRGPSTEYLILRNLEAGAAVQVLEQDSASGYSRVRVQDQGTEGWILTRFLTAEPIARDRLAAAERNLAVAKTRVAELEQQVGTLTAELGGTKTDLEQTRVLDLIRESNMTVEARLQGPTIRMEDMIKLEPGDILIDGGNSYYVDDIRRARELAPSGIHYLDVGSGPACVLW